MIKPHGSDALNPLYVEDDAKRAKLVKEGEGLPSIKISSAAAGNAVMLGSGYFNPLTGYMKKADALAVAKDMRMTNGLFWPTPVLSMVEDASTIKGAKRIALLDPNIGGNPVLAIQDVEAVEEYTDDEMKMMTLKVFGTDDPKHPGVQAFNSVGKIGIAGPIQVLNYSYFATDFPDTFRTAVQIRKRMEELGWNKVVAFQTRNPMHRAHEDLVKIAMEAVKADGAVIHMLLGKLKSGDIPANVRDAAIRKMVELYFEPNSALITGYGFDMLYAGPREAVLHAIFRQNMGCSHLIVGRDHAGVGDYYGAFDAQTIFDNISSDDLLIDIFRGDHTAYSKKLGKVVMMGSVKDHTKDDWVMLSGTKVRDMLAAGQNLPPEFARPEVAQILMKHYQSEAAKG
ncbi:MAG: sulfate adenylyltransferase [Desulfobacterales bacterium]|nr:sulfate adenylyltransferase [Desulfobacterales bacterium]